MDRITRSQVMDSVKRGQGRQVQISVSLSTDCLYFFLEFESRAAAPSLKKTISLEQNKISIDIRVTFQGVSVCVHILICTFGTQGVFAFLMFK